MNVPPFPADYRASGVLLHVTSLPSPYGIGDLGPTAVAWIDRLHDAGQGWWQAAAARTDRDTVTRRTSRCRRLRERAAHQPRLVDRGRTASGRATVGAVRSPPTSIDFEAVRQFKSGLLDTAWRNFRAGRRSDLRSAFEQFGLDHAHWLDDYALFRALKARYAGASYLQWPEPLVRRVPAALESARRDLASEVERVRFAQFLWFRQAERLHAHAHAAGVRLLGDLPFFVSADSSDVWSHPELVSARLAAPAARRRRRAA